VTALLAAARKVKGEMQHLEGKVSMCVCALRVR
jgi:hypothetical protein